MGVLLAIQAALGAPNAAASPFVTVQGNHLVDGRGHTVRLLGVDRSGSEYACAQGWGIFDSPNPSSPDTRAMVAAIRSWGANAVRIPLDEHCWLGINGVSTQTGGAAYRSAIATEVSRLEDQGIYAILDLHTGAPADYPAADAVNGLRPMPDADHSIDFWRSVANRFGSDRGVVFDLFNEPNGTASDPLTWSCLRDGCRITDDNYDPNIPSYDAAGMQTLVNAIRAQGAKNVIMVPGLQWTSDLSKWLAFHPSDPLDRIAASFHSYEAPVGGCFSTCWRNTIAPIAQKFPVITGEMGDTDCDHDYIDRYMKWADSHGVSYLGWAWDATAPGGWTCSGGPSLITSYDGTPTAYGVGLRDHLQALGG
jgi:hypothetical protein